MGDGSHRVPDAGAAGYAEHREPRGMGPGASSGERGKARIGSREVRMGRRAVERRRVGRQGLLDRPSLDRVKFFLFVRLYLGILIGSCKSRGGLAAP